jgi:hypothetical protein
MTNPFKEVAKAGLEWRHRAEKAEARVAELDAALRKVRTLAGEATISVETLAAFSPLTSILVVCGETLSESVPSVSTPDPLDASVDASIKRVTRDHEALIKGLAEGPRSSDASPTDSLQASGEAAWDAFKSMAPTRPNEACPTCGRRG